MDQDLGAAHIARVDAAFARLIQAVGPFIPRRPEENPFNSLVRAIIFQQLAGHAARAIHGRFAAVFDGHPTPERVLNIPIEGLRAVGLSGNKAASIADLARKATDGTVPLDRLDELSDAEIVQRLSAVRGIGRWTAEMFLIFQLRRPDVWPVDDLGVRKGFAVIHNLAVPPTPKALDALGEIYRPYRSAAAWYCWRAVETVLPEA
ncbi:MAG: DNA-3-methyladenine glycosylase 2 family protein [Chloroflexota bacterium]|nr:DNA-3-methyladenine glycosylase 2 family protein [Chloroflexota bacterium]